MAPKPMRGIPVTLTDPGVPWPEILEVESFNLSFQGLARLAQNGWLLPTEQARSIHHLRSYPAQATSGGTLSPELLGAEVSAIQSCLGNGSDPGGERGAGSVARTKRTGNAQMESSSSGYPVDTRLHRSSRVGGVRWLQLIPSREPSWRCQQVAWDVLNTTPRSNIHWRHVITGS